MKAEFQLIYFSDLAVSRLIGTKFRVGLEVFVCSRRIRNEDKAKTVFIFFGIAPGDIGDYKYHQAILFDPSRCICVSAPLLYLGRVPDGRAYTDTA